METITVNIKKKVRDVEILSSGKFDTDSYEPYIPEKFSKQEVTGFYPDSDVEFSKPIKTTKKKPKVKPTQITHITNVPVCSGFVDVDLSRTRTQNVSISDIQSDVEHAYDRGFDDAQQLTRTTFEIELQKRQIWVLNFESLIGELRKQFSHELSQLQALIIPLAVKIAEQILKHEVSSNPDLILEQVKNAIELIDKEIIFKIYIHPFNLDTLKNVKNDLLTEKSILENAEIIADSRVNQGSCILETSSGIIDASFTSQLEKIRTILETSVNG